MNVRALHSAASCTSCTPNISRWNSCSIIYERWLEVNQPTGRASGFRPVDVRTAIIEHFRDHGEIMTATEAASEGANRKFCSLVVNCDLPWPAPPGALWYPARWRGD